MCFGERHEHGQLQPFDIPRAELDRGQGGNTARRDPAVTAGEFDEDTPRDPRWEVHRKLRESFDDYVGDSLLGKEGPGRGRRVPALAEPTNRDRTNVPFGAFKILGGNPDE